MPTKTIKTKSKRRKKAPRGRPSESLSQWAARVPIDKRDDLIKFIYEDCDLVYGDINPRPNNREFLECLIDLLSKEPEFKDFFAKAITTIHRKRNRTH